MISAIESIGLIGSATTSSSLSLLGISSILHIKENVVQSAATCLFFLVATTVISMSYLRNIPSFQLFDTIVIDIKEESSGWVVIQTWEAYLLQKNKSTNVFKSMCNVTLEKRV